MSKNEKVCDVHGYAHLFLNGIRLAAIALAITIGVIILTALT